MQAAELEKTRGRLRLRLEKPFLAKLDGREHRKATTLDRGMRASEMAGNPVKSGGFLGFSVSKQLLPELSGHLSGALGFP